VNNLSFYNLVFIYWVVYASKDVSILLRLSFIDLLYLLILFVFYIVYSW